MTDGRDHFRLRHCSDHIDVEERKTGYTKLVDNANITKMGVCAVHTSKARKEVVAVATLACHWRPLQVFLLFLLRECDREFS